MSAVLGWFRTRSYGFALALTVALLIANLLARSSFGSPSSWPSILADFSPFALAAMASTPSILGGGGGIDISIGPSLNLVNIVVISVLIPHGLGSPWVAIPLALALGTVTGAVSGILVAVFRFRAVLATLCMLFVLEGVGMQILPQPASGTTAWLAHLGAKVGPIPGGLLLIAVPLVVWFALGRTRFIKTLYSVGGDDVASYSAGVNVGLVRIIAYSLGGLFAGVAGLALAAVTQSADPGQALQYTLPALAAVAIGGTSFMGGRGSLAGAIAGAAIIYLIQVLLDSLGVSDNWLQIVYGVLLLVAIIMTSLVSAAAARKVLPT
jgi:ribose transport system permease protein